jgi:hypothetical protein
LLAHAYRHASALMLAPFHYASLIWAVLAGWLVFEHSPDAWAWAGIALIVSCGLFKTRLQARALRQSMAPSPPLPSVTPLPAALEAQAPASALAQDIASVPAAGAIAQGGRK